LLQLFFKAWQGGLGHRIIAKSINLLKKGVTH